MLGRPESSLPAACLARTMVPSGKYRAEQMSETSLAVSSRMAIEDVPHRFPVAFRRR